MHLEPDTSGEDLVYRPGLDRIREAVISSHFMHLWCVDSRLIPYDDRQFSERAVTIRASDVTDRLLPSLRRASDVFARHRAVAARRRAIAHCTKYGFDDPRRLGPEQFITEAMFDRHFRRGAQETSSRQVLSELVARRIAAGLPVDMVIPALPFKLSCPLKTRGPSPDLAEVNFILGLYEIAATVDLLYREARPDVRGPLARFTVVSDGSRFNRLVDEPDASVEAYRADLDVWIRRLQLEDHVKLLDYRTLLQARLPSADRDAKEDLRRRALQQYAAVMWAVFDPCNMPETLTAAARVDPDPERSNPEGRFVSLLKSLVFTVNYRALDRFKSLPADGFRALYRELTGHMFEPFVLLSDDDLPRAAGDAAGCGRAPLGPNAKECLRRAMLRQVWSATIDYIAEIKSDRELLQEPISTCLPDHVRWTIHAKPGQLGLLTPSVEGRSVQAWAGAAVFTRSSRDGVRLCILPVLALEGGGAIPVRAEDAQGASRQPLFYVHRDVDFTDVDDFLAALPGRLVRKRSG